MTATLTSDELETAYDLLAEAIETAGEDRESLFLAKLCLTLCHQIGDLKAIQDAIDIASQDLDGPSRAPVDKLI